MISSQCHCCIPSFFAYTLKLTDRSERKGAIATIPTKKLREWELGMENGEEAGEQGAGDKGTRGQEVRT
ncbi:hypothetical protein [Nostoc sp. LEGE 12450]|uniref:hypothetical protein n=1 Tax=Nostoc sp. LEGE 12450 TaxID=1828643 RepID=UPI00187FB99B|nr:hypothetical protein [Nostoc sp. LEGE 12450]MBE8988368.1 hypothetical protein [Nostoc sp. LEGE 12450]